ncbi:MAG: hypothetical protein K9W46_13055 [Candidatus Heimdallarchaeum endolithica]|uniref:Uncharacterized protein n=1 Tax=Candidatus Heimdallarchaeum endolithica TaxID=2876572 RepID=A0A9Y1FN17_9ARCH|nr:MAG: hypothetical protein K9W46_13055 [Candidatus Heimdallarchaeum endolithica]
MPKLLGKLLILILLLPILIFHCVLSIKGSQPVLFSRISEITEITISESTDNPLFENYTAFKIEAEVEILNRADENQTVISPDLKLMINATLFNQSLKLVVEAMGSCMVTYDTYSPGITIENHFLKFYINQTDLTYLPDGNYTLWRPINEGEELPTIIIIKSGIMNITYSSFGNQETEAVNFSLLSPLMLFFPLFSYMIVFYRCKKSESA